jgi:hypothetical protein
LSTERPNASPAPVPTPRGTGGPLGSLAGVGVLGVLGLVGVRLLVWLFVQGDPPVEPPLVPTNLFQTQREDPALAALRRSVIATAAVSGGWTSYHFGVDDTVQSFSGRAAVAGSEGGKVYLVTPRDTLDLLRLSQSGILRLQVNEYRLVVTFGGRGKARSVTRFGFVDLKTALLEVDDTVAGGGGGGGDALREDEDYSVDPATAAATPAKPLKWYAADRAGAAQAIREVWGKPVSP